MDLDDIRHGEIVHLRGRVQSAGVYGREDDRRLRVSLPGGGEYTVPAEAVIYHEPGLIKGDRVRRRDGLTTEGEIVAVHDKWVVVADDDGSAPWVVALSDLERAS